MLLKIKKICLIYKIFKAKQVFIIIGSGYTKYEGWVSTNKEELNILNEDDFKVFSKKKIDKILLEHVIEHIEYLDFIKFLRFIKKYLNKRATIRVAVPDAYHPSAYYRDLVGINGQEPGANDHKYFYSIDNFTYIAKECNYKLNPLEYFDKKGIFQQCSYNFDNGYILRCSKNYQGRFTTNKEEYEKMIKTVPFHLRDQFKKYNISYTSLLADFIYE
jgi:predicted SAM-dependent methyltransferase